MPVNVQCVGPRASCPVPLIRAARRRLVRVARTYSTEAPDVCESLACSPGLVVPVYAKSAIMRAGVARGTGRGGVLASSPSSNTGLHAASHIRCKMVGEATR